MSIAIVPIRHDFQHQRADAVNDSPRQREFRRLAPMPFGSVLIARDDMDEDRIRWHLRTMRELGFNAIKQFMACGRWSQRRLEELALEEGLCPWWYGEGGWEPIDEALCRRLGIDPALPMPDIRRHPAMLAHQRGVLAARIGRERIRVNVEAQEGMAEHLPGSSARELGTDAVLRPEHFDQFIAWLRHQYHDDLGSLSRSWNCNGSYVGSPTGGYASWSEITFEQAASNREYGRIRDRLRWKADRKNAEVQALCRKSIERDRWEPQRSGGEMGLFLPFASRGTDMEGIAAALRDCGSFYPSIHLCWHFEETQFEVARPVYMQASFVVDLNKGGWTAPWESTGGPQHTSGAKAPLFEWVRDLQPGFAVTAGVMTQLQLSYLAAGCKGTGIWSWNARQAGVEAGEYALLDRNELVCERTRRVGAIALAANRWRDELWQAHKEPQVGILMDWDNEAVWAAMAAFNRTVFKHYPIEARIGASRACIDANVPFEYVTAANILGDLSSRYPVLYLPGFLGLSRKLLPLLRAYVERGGRLVLDLPGGCYDETGRVLPTGPGSDFEQLFGCQLADLLFSGTNVRTTLAGEPIHGYTADLIPTTARVAAVADDGLIMRTEHRLGAGTAVVLGWEAARACYRPGKSSWERRLVEGLLGSQEPFYAVAGPASVYRLAAPGADHWFLIQDGPACAVQFVRVPHRYSAVIDALTGEPIDLNQPVAVEANGGRWLRAEIARDA